MGGDHRGGKRHRREDGSHMRGGAPLRAGPAPAMNQELQEMREAIIHCDGSPEMLRNLSGLLAHDLPALTAPALEFVMECVQELPVKTPVYATLVGLLNPRAPAFVEEVVRAAIERLEHRLGSDDPSDRTRAKLLLRFLAILPSVAVLTPAAAIDVLDTVLCAAIADADAARPGWQPRADYLVYVVLAALPWAGGTLSSEAASRDAFERLCDTAEEYLGKRVQGPDPAAMTFAADATDDWLEEIWGRVNLTRKAGAGGNEAAWRVASIPPSQAPFAEELEGSAKHAPPQLAVPKKTFDGVAAALAAYPVRPRLRVLKQAMTEGLWEDGDWGPLERFVAEEYVADTLWAFEPGFRRGAVLPAAEQLGTLPLPGDHPERCQYLVAETLFGEMLALPRPKHEPVFYHVVVQDLCKAIQSFPKMMAKTVGQMFQKIALMDLEARERLADWMAHHLSCFDLAWPWQSWAHVADQPSGHPQRAFCASVVRRLARLCYHDRVAESLPEELRRALLPNPPGLNVDFIAAVSNDSNGALNDLRAMMKEKAPAEKVLEWFASSGKREAIGDEAACVALVTAALHHGQKCVAHHDVLLKRYAPAVAELAGPDSPAVIAAATGIWSGSHPHMSVVAASRALELGVTAPAAVARWIEAVASRHLDESGGDDESTRAVAGVAWGTSDALEIARLPFEGVAAGRDAVKWRLARMRGKIRAAEAEAARANAARAEAESRAAHSEADRAKAAEEAALDRAAAIEAESKAVAARVAELEAQTERLARDVVVSAARALAPRLADAARDAAKGIAPADAGKDAAPERPDGRALAMCAALFRRVRGVIGAEGEAAVHEALRGGAASEDVARVLGEALSGKGGAAEAKAAEAGGAMDE